VVKDNELVTMKDEGKKMGMTRRAPSVSCSVNATSQRLARITQALNLVPQPSLVVRSTSPSRERMGRGMAFFLSFFFIISSSFVLSGCGTDGGSAAPSFSREDEVACERAVSDAYWTDGDYGSAISWETALRLAQEDCEEERAKDPEGYQRDVSRGRDLAGQTVYDEWVTPSE